MFCNIAVSSAVKENVRNTQALEKNLYEIKVYYVSSMYGLLYLEFCYSITMLFRGISFLLNSQFTKSLGSIL